MNRFSILYDKYRVGYLFILPSIIILLVFSIIPLIASLVSSFYDFTFMLTKFDFVGLGNYRAVMSDERFWNSIRNTLYFTAVVVPVQNALSLLVALAVVETNRRNVFFRTVFFLPVVCSMTIVALSLAIMFDFNIGYIPAMMRRFGLPVKDFLNDLHWAMPTVMLISIYKSFGFSMLIFVAALHGVPKHLYEAAEMDGASPVQKFRNITLPSIAPTITFVLITGIIASFQVFDQVFVTTKGGPLFRTETAVQLIYYRAFAYYETGRASANAFLLFLLILAATILVQRMRRNTESYF